MSSAEERKKVQNEPCRCVTCHDCKGSGQISYSDNQFDNDTEPCDFCSGGIVEVCDRCQLLEEMDDWDRGSE